MTQNLTQTWLVSGASRGIGKAIALTALKAGHFVALGVRKMSDVQDVIGQFPDRALAVLLDMDKEADIRRAVSQTLGKFGRLDVLVNNAGYGLQGMIEEVTMPQIRQQMETNFFGLVALTREVLPHMRKQGTGYIVNVSSIAGLRGSAGLGIYNASKFAVEGFSEALAQEVAPFGIKVSLVEPGPYRTHWSGSSLIRSEAMKNLDAGSPYAGKNEQIKAFFDARSGNQPGDPFQIAQVVLAAAASDRPPLHMVFGDIAIELWEQRLEQLKDPSFLSVFPHNRVQL